MYLFSDLKSILDQMNRVARQKYRLLIKASPSSGFLGQTTVKFTASADDSTPTNVIATSKYAIQNPDLYNFEKRMFLIDSTGKRHWKLGKALLSFFNGLAASVGYCCAPGTFVGTDILLTMAGVQFCAMSAASMNIGISLLFVLFSDSIILFVFELVS